MNIHVFLLAHGKYGSPYDFDNFVNIFNRILSTKKTKYTIYLCKCNSGSTSYGIEAGGEKLRAEVEHYLSELNKTYQQLNISVIGHSLGGLYLRYAIGSLYTKFPNRWNWIGYYSLCTPHLGSRRPQEQSSMWRKIIYSSINHVLSTNTLFGQTGKDLLYEDVQREIPILQQMAELSSTYMKALKNFQFRTLIMLTDGDLAVPFASAGIQQLNPFNSAPIHHFWEWTFDCGGFQLKKQSQYLSHHQHFHSIIPQPMPSIKLVDYMSDSKQEVEFLPEVLNNLHTIPWRRIALTIQSTSIMAKLKLHEWPIAKGTINNRSGEFINIIELYFEILKRIPPKDMNKLFVFFCVSILQSYFTYANLTEEEVTNNTAYAALIIVTILVILSIVFEMLTEKLRDETDEMNMPFVNTTFSELTTLGFIGLLLFVASKLDMLSAISERYLGEADKLQETIEVLHMILFMFIIIFLVLCCILLRLGMYVQAEWREFERRVYDVNKVVNDFTKATEPMESWLDWLKLDKVRHMHKCHRELAYISIRSRFIDTHTNTSTSKNMELRSIEEYQKNPNLRFPFNEYLSIISGEVLGRLIEIDVITWIALEIIIVIMWLICWQAGQQNERFILLLSGFGLIFLNQYVYYSIDNMRHQLTPPILHKKAEILRRHKKWRHRHSLLPLSVNEKTKIKPEEGLTEDDYLPPFIHTLPNLGEGMELSELMAAQKAMLGGKGNGVLLALFSTRMVFLLTAVHLSVFFVRVAADIYQTYSVPVTLIMYMFFLLPSTLVTYMSTRIARDGLYCFNVEFMKVPRVITKVMRILKARQTLRTLRFVAEMKVYLREENRRNSVVSVDLSALSPKSDDSSASYGIISPRSAKKEKHHRKRDDPYEIEHERREINTIFCLFDSDGSGSISREEMTSLLQSITHDMNDAQISRIMAELDSENQGEITFEDFYQWCHSRIRQSRHTASKLIEEVFNMVDVDKSGEITVDEFIQMFKTLGQSLDHDDVRELVYQMDNNDDGKIDLEEFSKMLYKHAL